MKEQNMAQKAVKKFVQRLMNSPMRVAFYLMKIQICKFQKKNIFFDILASYKMLIKDLVFTPNSQKIHELFFVL